MSERERRVDNDDRASETDDRGELEEALTAADDTGMISNEAEMVRIETEEGLLNECLQSEEPPRER